MEVVYLFKSKILNFTCVVLQVQDDSIYTLGIGYPPNAIDFCIVPLLYGFLLCLDLKKGIYGMSAS